MQHEIHLDDFDEPIGVLEPPEPLVVESGSALRMAIDMLDRHNYGCVVIVRNKKLIGMLTERDVLMKIAGKQVNLDATIVDDYMTKNPTCLTMCDGVKETVKVFRKHGVRHIPIINSKRHPVGYTSVRGVIDFVVSYFSEEVLNLPPHPMRIGLKEEAGA